MTDRPKTEAESPLRWLAEVVYRTQRWLVDVDYVFEELAELHAIIERGPDWNAVERIVLTLNPARAAYPGGDQ
jgi:hypothetical protein